MPKPPEPHSLPILSRMIRAKLSSALNATISHDHCVPNGMAFNVEYDDGSVLTVTINQTLGSR